MGSILDAAVNVSFGGKINHSIEVVFKSRVDRLLICDARADELVSGVIFDIGETLGIARIGQFVKIDDLDVFAGLQ